MKILLTGICGFVGSTLARGWRAAHPDWQLVGLDNFIRPGSETNRESLKQLGVQLFHGDLRQPSDLESLPAVDWVIDAAANPSVLAGVDGQVSSRQLVEHNLGGTLNLLEFCQAHRAGLVLLSTSRVYSIKPLAELAVESVNNAFRPALKKPTPGLTAEGVSESFPTAAPVSLYGATKLASESLALEYGEAFGFPVWVNRCGVLAGAGQFGRADQGIFAYWLNAWLRQQPLKYIGFSGQGHQVRDCLHPRDLLPLLEAQLAYTGTDKLRVQNVSGGVPSARSLAQLSEWCGRRFGPHPVTSDPTPRPFDLPWLVLDSARAKRQWQWQPATPTDKILEEIAQHAQQHPNWLALSAPF
jgi:CDP-paratose 2-epimerase